MLAIQPITVIGPYQVYASKVRLGLSICPFIGLAMNILNQPHFNLLCCVDSPYSGLSRRVQRHSEQMAKTERDVQVVSSQSSTSSAELLNSARSTAMGQEGTGNERQRFASLIGMHSQLHQAVGTLATGIHGLEQQNRSLEQELAIRIQTEHVYSLCCLGSALSSLAIVVTLIALQIISMSLLTVALIGFTSWKILSATIAILILPNGLRAPRI